MRIGGVSVMDIRLMRIEDYDETWGLWIHTKEMALNNLDDSREGIRKFLRRNPSTCFVAKEEQKIVGVILAGNDGRRGYIYHLAVLEEARRKKIATKLLNAALEGLKKEGITEVAVLAKRSNECGNLFWEEENFDPREDLVYRCKNLIEIYRIETE